MKKSQLSPRRNPAAASTNASLFVLLLSLWCPTLRAQTETPFAIAEVELNLPIPDGDLVSGVTSSIRVPGEGLLESLDVAVAIDHPAVEQLVIRLNSPEGVSAVLHNQQASLEQPFTPVYETDTLATESLSRFLGRPAQGDWTLEVIDLVSGDVGTLQAWGMRYRPASLARQPPPTPVGFFPETFFERTRIAVAQSITSMHSFDANRDGIDDIALVSAEADLVLIYQNTGEGLNPIPLTLNLDAPQRMIDGDMNGDGRTDLVVAAQPDDTAVVRLHVWLGTDGGGFIEDFEADISITTELDALALVDANRDGNLDIVVGGIPKLFTGIGDGTFQLEGDLVDLGRRFLSHGDVNGDGLDEMLVVRSRGGTSSNVDPYILFASDDLTFIDRQRATASGAFLQGAFAVVTQPGEPEFVIVSDTEELEPTFWFSEINPGLLSEADVEETRLAGSALRLPFEARDLNGDGLAEFIFLDETGVVVFQRSNSPTGGQSQRVFMIAEPLFVEPGRYFSDGSLGLLVLNAEGNLILAQSFLGAAPTATPTGVVPATPTPFLFPPLPTLTPTVAPTATPLPPGTINPDINLDGIVNAEDLLMLMQFWGERFP